MKRKKLIHIGTSGWQYEDWKKNFYPEDTTGPQMLAYYAGKFRTCFLKKKCLRFNGTK
jgi:uncharacterized protein YecE (DUF72 family)